MLPDTNNIIIHCFGKGMLNIPFQTGCTDVCIPAYLPSQIARSFIGISNGGWFPGSYVAWIESCSSLLLVAGRSLAFISKAHCPSSLNNCSIHYLTIIPLEGVTALNHIQISISDVLSEPSSSCQMAAGTPSGLCCHWASITTILAGVPFQILKHNGFFDLATSCTHHMSVCMAHVHNTGAMVSMTLAVSMKNRSIMGHRLNHCTLLRLVWLRGQGSWPVWDNGRPPMGCSSPIPGRFAKCSGTGLHRNGTAGSPGGGSMILGEGPKILFFIMMHSIVILFTTPSLSWQKVGSVSELQ